MPKSQIWKITERAFIIVAVVVAASAAVKASDKYFNNKAKEDGVCPADMVVISSPAGEFCIDRYEASAGENCPNANPGSQASTKENLQNAACQPVSVPGAMPWVNISQDQADVACAKAGKRLPTNNEWYAAALATPDIDSNWTGDDCQVSRNWPSQPGSTGSGKNCRSAAGAYDMIGNVWEWVKGAISDGKFEGKQLPESGFIDSTDGDSLPARTNPNTPNENYNQDYFWIKNKGARSFARGGYWDNKTDAGQYSVYLVSEPSFAGSGIGFRCVK